MSKKPIVEMDKLKELIDKGLSSCDIAKLVNCHQGTVSSFLKRNGEEEYIKKLTVNARSNSLKNTKVMVENLGVDFDRCALDGLSYSQISKQFKIAPQTLMKYVRHFLPTLDEKFVKNGNRNKQHFKVSQKDLKEMLFLSKKGIGIDSIGSMLNIDGTTVRLHLIKSLGEEEYRRRHPSSRFYDNNGWNGKSILYKGKVYQSHGEIAVAKVLYDLNLDFELHKIIKIGDKRYVPDFYVKSKDLYIEYAGLLNKKFYRVKFMQKINDYSAAKINFIVVGEDNIDLLNDLISERS